ncbi:MAG: GerMN domain-containing protein [Endomicrobia bacterium]|nr:GerMN domain-containing protein [Endomicrobiia bacterium]
MKRQNLVFTIIVLLLILHKICFCMAKKYPLQETDKNNITTTSTKIQRLENVETQNNTTKDVVVQQGLVKHGVNLRVLPKKNEYQIGLIDTKNGLIKPVVRYLPAAEQLPQDVTERVVYAINELLKGPTEEEKSKEYISLFPEGTKLQRCEVIVDDFGIRVKLEFSEEILKDIDEIKNILIQEQIKYTLISLDIPKIYGADVFVKGKPLGYYAFSRER